MTVYIVTHNIESLMLASDHYERTRFFNNLESANRVFEECLQEIDYSEDEYISLTQTEVGTDESGEYQVLSGKTLRYFSDDTKIGVNFNPSKIEDDEED